MPRIEPLPPEEWSDEMGKALAPLRPPEPRHEMPRRDGRPKGLNALGTFAHHPALALAYHTFNGHILFASTLTPRQRELAVLRVAALRQCDYEWTQHLVMSGDAGISAEEVRWVLLGPDSPGWSDADRFLLRAVDELIGSACVSDSSWSALEGHLDRQQLMDLVFTVGAYDTVAMAFLSFGVELDEDLRGVGGPPLRPTATPSPEV